MVVTDDEEEEGDDGAVVTNDDVDKDVDEEDNKAVVKLDVDALLRALWTESVLLVSGVVLAVRNVEDEDEEEEKRGGVVDNPGILLPSSSSSLPPPTPPPPPLPRDPEAELHVGDELPSPGPLPAGSLVLVSYLRCCLCFLT